MKYLLLMRRMATTVACSLVAFAASADVLSAQHSAATEGSSSSAPAMNNVERYGSEKKTTSTVRRLDGSLERIVLAGGKYIVFGPKLSSGEYQSIVVASGARVLKDVTYAQDFFKQAVGDGHKISRSPDDDEIDFYTYLAWSTRDWDPFVNWWTGDLWCLGDTGSCRDPRIECKEQCDRDYDDDRDFCNSLALASTRAVCWGAIAVSYAGCLRRCG